MTTIAIIGAGHMGSSLIGGLVHQRYPVNDIWATDLDEEKLQTLADQFGIHVTTNNQIAIEAADVIIIAVKPSFVQALCATIRPMLATKNRLMISIAAGIRETALSSWLGQQAAVVRAMPNLPALVGHGATAYYANRNVHPEQKILAESLLHCVGTVVSVEDESMLDAVTALSGSGPAYFFALMQAMLEGANKMGLDTELARELILQTAYGASFLARNSDKTFVELIEGVASPAGTTESALNVLAANGFNEKMIEALQAAKARSIEIADQLGKTDESTQ